jgi:hypothetical protein
MMKLAVEHGAYRCGIAQQLVPVPHGAIRGHQCAGEFVASHDELKQSLAGGAYVPTVFVGMYAARSLRRPHSVLSMAISEASSRKQNRPVPASHTSQKGAGTYAPPGGLGEGAWRLAVVPPRRGGSIL